LIPPVFANPDAVSRVHAHRTNFDRSDQWFGHFLIRALISIIAPEAAIRSDR